VSRGPKVGLRVRPQLSWTVQPARSQATTNQSWRHHWHNSSYTQMDNAKHKKSDHKYNNRKANMNWKSDLYVTFPRDPTVELLFTKTTGPKVGPW